MKPEDMKTWASLIYLMPDDRLRDSGSKHQKRIKLIQDQVKQLSENPSAEVLYPLMVMTPIECEGETEYVAHCRYLQHCVKVMVNNVQKNEGT